VQHFLVNGGPDLSSNTLYSVLVKYTGTNVSLAEIANAASELQSAYSDAGYTNLSVAFAQDRITNGIATLNLFRAVVPQILISGKRYTNASPGLLLAGTQGKGSDKAKPPQRFSVRAYEITGDTLLSSNSLMSIFAKHTGTNVTVTDILTAASDMQSEYRARGYPTVKVTIPQQQLTNGLVKIRVFEGVLSDITVAKNHYFSSNNVMRAMPGLHTNTILNGSLFQAELDRANANQDRQIYPVLEAGPVEDTSVLRLEVKDRLPLHGKVEFNNQSSPGTPELRINSSAVYNNLWQLEHSVGLQYSFSPGAYKAGSQWDFYDLPLVANYSGFYRLPIGAAESVEDIVASSPGTFGYDEATRKFRLPPSNGRSELNFYASRSTIDSGLETTPPDVLLETPARTITKSAEQEDLTKNEDLGFRLSTPLPQFLGIRSVFSGGFDWKHYDVVSSKTFVYTFTELLHHTPGDAGYTQVATLLSPVPSTEHLVYYAPMMLHLDANHRDKLGAFDFGIGYSDNFLGGAFDTSQDNFRNVAGSQKANGYYHIINGSFSREQVMYRQPATDPNAPPREWPLTLKLEGQWANQPLISNEQFGIGGVNSVRGYREGEVFGDLGWRVGLEQKTPPYIVGTAYGTTPLIVWGSLYMDYAEVYLLDPLGRQAQTSLWGTGFGGIISLGPHFEARLLFSWPLLGTTTTTAYQPRFNFSLSAQF
jgi:hemolysin activation/secretion protein